MIHSKTIYGIEQHMILEGKLKGNPEAKGAIRELTPDSIAMLLDTWDFRYATINMPHRVLILFPTEEAAKLHLHENAVEVGPHYLKNFKFEEA